MAETEYRTVTLSLHGPSICQLARDKFKEGRMQWALDLLTSCLQTDQLSKSEILTLAYNILDGRGEIVGTYPNDDYGYKPIEDESKWNQIPKYFDEMAKKVEEYKEKCEQVTDKLRYLDTNLSPYDRDEFEEMYQSDFDEPLFKTNMNQPEPNDNMSPGMSSILQSFLENQKTGCTDDYGWLEPNGTFHPVDFGEHQSWAEEYVRENMSEEAWLEAGATPTFTGTFHTFGDYLITKGWVLLDNPSMGLAYVTKAKPLTKHQKEFLFDYWTKRNQPQRANELYQDD